MLARAKFAASAVFGGLAAVVVVDAEVVPFDTLGQDVPDTDQQAVTNGRSVIVPRGAMRG